MDIFVDPQGNFRQATDYCRKLSKLEPANFKIFVVSDTDYITAVNSKNIGNEVKFINGVFKETEKTVDELKQIKVMELYKLFVEARDAKTMVTISEAVPATYEADGVTIKTPAVPAVIYGYDRTNEDITNFMAARARAELGSTVHYNVWVSETQKDFLPHTFAMFNTCLEQSATEQTLAYLRFKDLREQVTALTNEETIVADLEAIVW